ncbi:hypothetical protein [Hydrogenimonas sp.]|uniref:hypothetical protein n=1 Tax=Hydrogenimonas sp. TaxID=2231112 RepID=UPI00263242F3|nr:hypothetical protein [Hydrogenimonas sp.]
MRKRKDADPLCVPSFPSICKWRYRLLKKRNCSRYAADLYPTCSLCYKRTGGKNRHVNKLNDLILKLL